MELLFTYVLGAAWIYYGYTHPDYIRARKRFLDSRTPENARAFLNARYKYWLTLVWPLMLPYYTYCGIIAANEVLADVRREKMDLLNEAKILAGKK